MKVNVSKLNQDIKKFPNVFPVEEGMNKELSGVSRMVMLDRYSWKDIEKKTLEEGDFVVLTVKDDPKWPVRGLGLVKKLDWTNWTADIEVLEEFRGALEDTKEIETGIVNRSLDVIEKPLEIYYEQIAKRNARGLSEVESDPVKRAEVENSYFELLSEMDFVPAGRVLYGAGAGTEVTYFNCFVLPFPQDSRGGISDHRKTVMEIMSRGGGVGTNGSTLRPKNAIAKGVNGKSSGSVSWLNDIANLTNLVEQGGSRRGAQMIMMSDWAPDIVEFIVSKMQNPKILRFLLESIDNEFIKSHVKAKLKFTALSDTEREQAELITKMKDVANLSDKLVKEAEQKLKDGGIYTVVDPTFLDGANISVCLTKEFMQAVEEDGWYDLRFPDIESYGPEEMKAYNENWHHIGDVREWEAMGYQVKTYRKIKAKDLWNLINICATYSAEPGIFFIDNANEKTNAAAYGQKVVATNPCGEQPLAPFSVCNLAAVNLANVVDKENKVVDYGKLSKIVETGVRMQDNVIDASPYFLEENKKQALGERRLGLGVMGLHDLLIYCETVYGSEEGNQLVDKVFETIATSAYQASVELAKEKGSFPFLIGQTEEETMELRRKFVNSGYVSTLPESIKEDILRFGIRNSHLLTVAPTGSTGTMVGVSTGLEPYFAFSYFRSGRLGKFIEVKAPIVQEYLDRNPEADPNNLPEFFISAMELSPEAHADVQCIIQRWVDSSISKTVNAPKGYTVEQVEKVYERLYHGGAKGGTVYVDGSRDAQVLTLTNEENDLSETDVSSSANAAEVEESTEGVFTVHANNAKEIVENFVDSVNNTDEKEDVKYGTEPGDTCPICRHGVVEELGGCVTCTSCGSQLKCGL